MKWNTAYYYAGNYGNNVTPLQFPCLVILMSYCSGNPCIVLRRPTPTLDFRVTFVNIRMLVLWIPPFSELAISQSPKTTIEASCVKRLVGNVTGIRTSVVPIQVLISPAVRQWYLNIYYYKLLPLIIMHIQVLISPAVRQWYLLLCSSPNNQPIFIYHFQWSTINRVTSKTTLISLA